MPDPLRFSFPDRGLLAEGPSAVDPAGPVAMVCAVALEMAPVAGWLQSAERTTIGRKPAARGLLDDVPVVLLAAGMGKTNAAHALTALLERERVRGVINFGVAGAYAGSGLEVGATALASAEIYGDDGVETPHGWISTEGIGIPLLRTESACRFNEFPLDPERVAAAGRALAAAGIESRTGPFVTLSSCSGTTKRGVELSRRFRALCESMEGAALAHVCAIYGVPFLEARGISNAVEDRDLSRWRIREASEVAARAARVLVGLF
ncbi:MAG: futalosine hydrolase [Gemmatimonadetes bacterium]|nr:futalosine hydrolase [Gemmatimonadota bacterium]